MKVIIIKNKDTLGKEGDVVEVKDGYARNYLFPQGIALAAIKDNYKKLEEIKRKKLKLLEKEKQNSVELKNKIEKISLTITAEAKGEDEIYGSIGETQLLKLLKEEGIELNKNMIVLEEPIRKLGVYSLKIHLHQEIDATLRVWIVKK